MMELFAVFSLFLVPLAHGIPLSNTSPVLDDPDLTATEIIDIVNQEVDVEPSLFEGDILPVSNPDEPSADNLREKRNARRLRKYIWKSKIIPYVISSALLTDGYEPTILAAIQQFTQHTCITWKPLENEERWVTFVKKTGCYSSVGVHYWKTGSQDISLGDGCNHQGVIMHEMMHAAGFWHEQSRYDRNQYVEILWENIKPGKEHNFNKYDLHEIDYLNEVYDTDSIMHYGKTSFSINDQLPTIRAIGDQNKQLGQRNGFSQTDIAQLNALYDCSGPSGGWSSWTAFGPCDSQCTHKRQRFCASHDLANCPGADYYGIETKTEKCPDEKCYAPVDGHWGKWSAWSSCSVTCDTGKHSRTRQCNDPSPMHGGKDCVGESQETGDCVLRRCGLGPYDCEFEAGGMCHWAHCANVNPYPRWYRHNGPTGSSGTGPQGDHTSGSGNYLYFEASSPAQPQQTSCFFSQELPGGSCQHLTFWYHMLGTGMGELRVLLKDTAGTTSTVWRKIGEQGDQWLQAKIEIKKDANYKVYFEGVRGGDFRGDIAIDDITFEQCPVVSTTLPPTTTKAPSTTVTPTTTKAPSTTLPPTTTKAPSTTKVPSTTLAPTTTKAPSTALPPTTTKAPPTTLPPTTTKAPSTTLPPTTTQAPSTTLPPTSSAAVLDSCDFDSGGMCDWKNRKYNPSNYNWLVHSGATRSTGTGPSGDHSASGQGGYIYLEASSPVKAGYRGQLISKEFSGTSAKCLSFWYHMYGDAGMGSLRVFVKRGNKRWEQWVKTGNRGNQWLYRTITVKKHKRDKPFKLIFEGTRGTSWRGDIALDGIKVNDGAC